MNKRNLLQKLIVSVFALALLHVAFPLQAMNNQNNGMVSIKTSSTVSKNPQEQKRPKMIAHRGSYVGNAQNSRASLRNAQELGVYGSETDVWITTDGHLMINHDPAYNDVIIKESTSDECKALILPNGEHMPELQDFLEMIKTSKSPTRLCIEIKDHGSKELNEAVADAVTKAVSDYHLKKKVEYCSFSTDVCDEILRNEPNARVTFLGGTLTPAQLHERKYTGFSYLFDVIREHPEWMKEAKDLGLTTHVWQVNTPEDMEEAKQIDVDFITTDVPKDALTWY